MAAKNFTTEAAANFLEVANLLAMTVESIRSVGDLVSQLPEMEIDAPDKTKAINAITALESWAGQARQAYVQAKIKSGELGPDTRGKSNQAGRPSPGSGRRRRPKEEAESGES